MDNLVSEAVIAPPERLSYALTDKDVHRLLPGVPLTLYSDLTDKSLSSLLDSRGRGMILFVESEKSSTISGHWLAVATQPDGLLVFDPYGGRSQDPWYLDRKFISNRDEKALNESAPHLHKLITSAGIKPIYSTVRYQELQKGIDTCGRHCVVRLWHKDRDLKRYDSFMDTARSLTGATFDELVTSWTDDVLLRGQAPPRTAGMLG